MRLQEWPDAAGKIIETFNERGISYDAPQYSGLVMPASVVLTNDVAQQIRDDISEIWTWIHQWISVYRDLLHGADKSNSVLVATEWGLSADALEFQRLSTELGEEPSVGRIDSVTLETRQKIAEVQWKGGGEGFIAAIDHTYRHLFPLREGQWPLGELAHNWRHVFRRKAGRDVIHVLNTGRSIWRKGEQFLADELEPFGIKLLFLSPDGIPSALRIQDEKVCVEIDGELYPVDFIYLDRLSEAVSPETLTKLCRLALDGKVKIEPPPSYIFNQKIGLALPFMPDYRNLFSDQIREILIPSVLVTDDKPNCNPLINSISHPKRDLLGDLQSWDDILRLPRSLRECLIFKCASADQEYNHGGHGVWQIGGSTEVAKRNLERILNRVKTLKEPWIVQPYIHETRDVPVAHPDTPDVTQRINAHARFGIYCGYQNQTSFLLGGIANFGSYWKVAGKKASYDEHGHLTGSAFTDIRVE